MKTYEFDNTSNIDIEEESIILAQMHLNDNPQYLSLLESAYDHTLYRSVIDDEKQYTVPITQLVKNNSYAPLSITGTPIAKSMVLFTTTDAVYFKDYTDSRLIFNDSNNRTMSFPLADRDIGDSCIDILIFGNIEKRAQFITILNIKFSDWFIKDRCV